VSDPEPAVDDELGLLLLLLLLLLLYVYPEDDGVGHAPVMLG